MKKKMTFKDSMTEIKKVSNKIPKTINEAINFNEMDDVEIGDDFQEDDVEPETTPIKEPVSDDLNVETFINDTRKKSLKIMAKLADEPENKVYDIAKRIWQICDKTLVDEKNDNITNRPQEKTF